MAAFKLIFIEMRDGYRRVLLFAFGIDKAKVNKGALFLFNQLHYVSDGFCHANLLNK